MWVPSGRYCVIIFPFAVSFPQKANVPAADPDYAISSGISKLLIHLFIGDISPFFGGGCHFCCNNQTSDVDNSTSQPRSHLSLSLWYCTQSSHWDRYLTCKRLTERDTGPGRVSTFQTAAGSKKFCPALGSRA